jgi:hypothetical protein
VVGFWLTVRGALFDVCVLEWCKLFGSRSSPYHWSEVLLRPEQFKDSLLKLHDLDQQSLDALWEEVKTYRDEFVAHLDVRETTPMPNMSVPHLLTLHYYCTLQMERPELSSEPGLPGDIYRYYGTCLEEARSASKAIR